MIGLKLDAFAPVMGFALLLLLLSPPLALADPTRPSQRATSVGGPTAMVPDPCPHLEGGSPEQQERYKLAELERAGWDWGNRCAYRQENQRIAKPVRAVFIGDSITQYWGADEEIFRRGIVGRGIIGQTTPQMLLRFYDDVVALRPQAVHILAGTNDIAGNTGPSTVGDYKSNIKAMVAMAKANGIRVVLASIPPASTFPWKIEYRPAAVIQELNTWLRSFATEQAIEFVDYYKVLAADDGSFKRTLSDDGVHPNMAGYAAMRPLTLAALGRVGLNP